MKKKKKSKRLSAHHVIARSRHGPSLGNIVWLSENIHKSYHILFGNMLPEEAEAHLRALHERWITEARKRDL